MDRYELAWAAGFFDGEGSAWAQAQKGRRTAQPYAQINQADPHGIPVVLERFKNAVGVGTINGPRRKAGRIDLYSWIVSSRPDVQCTSEALGPWLGPVKARDLFVALGTPIVDPARDGLAPWPTTESLAWAVGLYDGEGSTYLLKHGSHIGHFVIEASITQSSDHGIPIVLARFAEAVRCGRIYGPYSQEPPWSLVYRWKAHRRVQIETMLVAIWPWLGPVKRQQAEAAMEVIRRQPQLPRGNPAWSSYKTHCVHGHEYATARIRPYVGRGKNVPRRESSRCLACLRDHARRKKLDRQK